MHLEPLVATRISCQACHAIPSYPLGKPASKISFTFRLIELVKLTHIRDMALNSTGKDLLCDSCHSRSSNRDRSFFAIDKDSSCALHLLFRRPLCQGHDSAKFVSVSVVVQIGWRKRKPTEAIKTSHDLCSIMPIQM